MSIKSRIERIEKQTNKKNVAYIWVNIGETKEEALKKNGRKIKKNDEVYYFSWEA